MSEQVKTGTSFIGKMANFLVVIFALSIPVSVAVTVAAESMLLLIWMFMGEWKKKLTHLMQSRISVIVLLFVVYNLLVVLWSADKAFALTYVEKYRHFLMIPAISYYLTPRYARHAIAAFVIVNVVVAMLALVVYFAGVEIGRGSQLNPSPFKNHVDFGIFLAISALILLNELFVSEYRKVDKWVIGAIVLLLLGGLVIGTGRTGQVAFIVGLLFVMFVRFRRQPKWMAISVLLTFLAIVVAYCSSDNVYKRFNLAAQDIKGILQNDYASSVGARYGLWEMGVKKILEEPIFGYGIGDEMVVQREYLENSPDYDERSRKFLSRLADNHNTFVTLALQGGMINLLIVLMLLYIVWSLPLRDKEADLSRKAFLVVFLVASMGGHAFHLFATMTFFSLFAGIIDRLSREEGSVK